MVVDKIEKVNEISDLIQKIAQVGSGKMLTNEQLLVAYDFVTKKTKRIAEIANAASGKTSTNTAIVHTLRIVGKTIQNSSDEFNKKVIQRIVDEQYHNIQELANSVPEECGYSENEILYISFTNAAVDTSRDKLKGVECECRTIHSLACDIARGFFLTDAKKWGKRGTKTAYDKNHPFFKALRIQSYDDILFTATNFSRKKTFQYKFVILDEAQDTCDNAFKLLDTVCGTNSFLQTGDPKQSLYGLSGKTYYHLHGFTEYILTKNFRSNKKIVEYGNTVANQKAGLLNASVTQKKKVEVESKFFENASDSVAMLSDAGEIIFLDELSKAADYMENGCVTYILAGTNSEINDIRKIEALGTSYYDIAPSKVSDNPSDLIPFFDSIVSNTEKSMYENLPEAERLIDGVGEKTMERIFKWFEENPVTNKTVSEVLQILYSQDIPYLKEKFFKMYKFFEIRNNILKSTYSDINEVKHTLLNSIEILYNNTQGFIAEQSFSKDSYDYLVRFINNFCDNYNLPLKDFIIEFGKNIKEDYGARYLNDGESQQNCQYSISTIHNSKGKEFDTVILIFNQKGICSTIGVNLYVAVTRAKKRLIIVGMPEDFIKNKSNS